MGTSRDRNVHSAKISTLPDPDAAAREMGATADVKIGGPWAVKAQLTRKEDQYRHYSSAQTDVTYQIDRHWSVGVGSNHL